MDIVKLLVFVVVSFFIYIIVYFKIEKGLEKFLKVKSKEAYEMAFFFIAPLYMAYGSLKGYPYWLYKCIIIMIVILIVVILIVPLFLRKRYINKITKAFDDARAIAVRKRKMYETIKKKISDECAIENAMSGKEISDYIKEAELQERRTVEEEIRRFRIYMYGLGYNEKTGIAEYDDALALENKENILKKLLTELISEGDLAVKTELNGDNYKGLLEYERKLYESNRGTGIKSVTIRFDDL